MLQSRMDPERTVNLTLSLVLEAAKKHLVVVLVIQKEEIKKAACLASKLPESTANVGSQPTKVIYLPPQKDKQFQPKCISFVGKHCTLNLV